MNSERESTELWSGTLEERNGWHVTSYDPSGRNASEAVAFGLAALAGTEPGELRPLHESIDPDALDSLFAPTIDGRSRVGGEVTFTHDGYAVAVGHDGEIRLRSVTDARGAAGAGTATSTED